MGDRFLVTRARGAAEKCKVSWPPPGGGGGRGAQQILYGEAPPPGPPPYPFIPLWTEKVPLSYTFY